MLRQFLDPSSPWQLRLLSGPYSLLLLLLISMWFTFGLLPRDFAGIVVPVQMASVVAVTFKTLVVSRRKQALYIMLAALALGGDLILRLLDFKLPYERPSSIILATIWAIFFGFSVILIGQSLFQHHVVTLDTIVGGVCIFLMLGSFWFAVYGVLMLLSPDAISGPDGSISDFDLMYFSFTTLTSLGYGEFVPVSIAAKIASNLEAVVGVLYPAIFIGKLVNSF
ncbi:MAG: potassium channel family protein [Synechococcus sp.]